MRRATILALTAAAACVAFAIAAPLSAAKSVAYEAPLALPELDDGPGGPAIVKFRVEFDGKKPTWVYNIAARDTYLNCQDGSIVWEKPSAYFNLGIKVNKQRRFSGSQSESSDSRPVQYNLTGKVARNGTVSGTIRMAFEVTFVTYEVSPPETYTTFCDTGVLSWTATK